MIWKGVSPEAGMETSAQMGKWYKPVLFLLKDPYEFPGNLIKCRY